MTILKTITLAVFLVFGTIGGLHCQVQGSRVVEISGVVIDAHFKKPIANALVEVFGMTGLSQGTVTDSTGRYALQCMVTSDSARACVMMRCSADEMLTVNDQVFVQIDDELVIRDFMLRWTGPCIDTFAPGYVHFQKGVACPSDSVEQYIKDWVPTALEVVTGSVPFKVEILSSASYDEPHHLSKRREACIRELLVAAGLPDSVIVTEDLAQEPFYYCRYCEGCLPRWLYGTGDLLSRDSIQGSPNGDELNALRRMVHLAFVHPDAPKVDRTLRPQLR